MEAIFVHPFNYKALTDLKHSSAPVAKNQVAGICLVRAQLGCLLPKKGKNNTKTFTACAKTENQEARRSISTFCRNCPVALHHEADILRIAQPAENLAALTRPTPVAVEPPEQEEDFALLDRFADETPLRTELPPVPDLWDPAYLLTFEESVMATPLRLPTFAEHEAIFNNALRIAASVIQNRGFSQELSASELADRVHQEAQSYRQKG